MSDRRAAPHRIAGFSVTCLLVWASACNAPAGTVRGVGGPTGSVANSVAGIASPPGGTAGSSMGTVAPTSGPPVTGTHAVNPTPVDFGPNVLVFDANMAMGTIQAKLDSIATNQASNHFGTERYAYLFKPGSYALDVQLNFMMTAAGLGAVPDDVTITGAVRSKASWNGGNATLNFWRGAENLSVVPTQDNNTMVWAVSQGTSLRRMHVKGPLNLSDDGYSSGGFVADSKVDGVVNSGSQQQFLTRNSALGQWLGKNWNMVFVGVAGAPSGSWPSSPYSVVTATPIIREKPYLSLDGNGAYVVRYPPLKTVSQSMGWSDAAQKPAVIPMTSFYVAHAASDTADTLNGALKKGLHVLFTPGIYKLTAPLQVTFQNTILLGMGLATLTPSQGTAAVVVSDVAGVTIGGLLLDAGANNSPTLLQIGTAPSSVDHSANPTVLADISCRIGGAGAAKASSCITINSSNVLMDNIWLWRADHGDGAGWTSNPSLNGVIVNGANVTAYGLFSEHFQGYQTLWNGNNGATYMYQSEFPYDPPNQSSWRHDNVNGYASYKVASNVTKHTAVGLGMYGVFANPVVTDNAIESPTSPGVTFNHIITVWLGVADGSAINHIINGTGGAAESGSSTSMTSY
jgi:hypothetical protein